jgi:hypothetical protein
MYVYTDISIYRYSSPHIFDDEYYQFDATLDVRKVYEARFMGTITSSTVLDMKRSISFMLRSSRGDYSMMLLHLNLTSNGVSVTRSDGTQTFLQ